MKKGIFHFVLFIGLAALIVFLVVANIKPSKGAANGPRNRGPQKIAVEVAPTETRTMVEIGVFNGSLIPRSQFVVAPKVSGRLRKLYVNVGDVLKPGHQIAELEDEEFEIGRAHV